LLHGGRELFCSSVHGPSREFETEIAFLRDVGDAAGGQDPSVEKVAGTR
jgi:hypothetical protein